MLLRIVIAHRSGLFCFRIEPQQQEYNDVDLVGLWKEWVSSEHLMKSTGAEYESSRSDERELIINHCFSPWSSSLFIVRIAESVETVYSFSEPSFFSRIAKALS